MGLFDFLFGKKQQPNIIQTPDRQLSNLTPGQEALFSQLLGGKGGAAQNQLFRQAEDALSSLISAEPQSSRAFADAAIRNFEQEILPGVAERFAGLGGGALSSSGFRNAALGQARILAENLAASEEDRQLRRQQALQNAIGQAFSFGQVPFSQALSLVGLPTKATIPGSTFVAPEQRSAGLLPSLFSSFLGSAGGTNLVSGALSSLFGVGNSVANPLFRSS